MQFSFSDDQIAFRDAVRSVFKNQCTVDDLRGAWSGKTGRIAGLWDALVQQGITLMTLPETMGGLDCGPLDTVLIFEEAGRACVPEPLIEVVAVAVPLLVDAAAEGSGDALDLMDAVAEGALVIPMFDGTHMALYADKADYVLVGRDDRLLAVAKEHLHLTPATSADRTRRFWSVDFEGNNAIELAKGPTAMRLIQEAQDRGALAASAFLLGLGHTMIKLAVDHVTTREQFGTPIGTFQAVQHRIVNGWRQVEIAGPIVYRAAYELQNRAPDAPLHISTAKVMASDAAYGASREALQVHGAIGYTTEYELHMFMKRTWALVSTWGDQRYHEKRVEHALLDA